MYTATYIMSASIENTRSKISTQKVAFIKKNHGFMNFKIQSTITKWCNGSENLQMLPQGIHGSKKRKVHSSKVEIPNSDTLLHRTPKFEWFVVWCGSKNGHQKGITCSKEIGVHAQNMITILGSIVNITFFWGGDTCMTI